MKINNEKKKREITGWYEKYYRIMRARAHEIVGDYHIADDMVSEAFIKVFNNYEKIRKLEEPQVAFYLISIIRNISIDYTRKRKRENTHVNFGFEDNEIEKIPDDDESKYPEIICARKELQDNLKNYMDKLSQKDAELIVYKYLWNMSEKEISEMFHIKQEHVHVYVGRAKKRLFNIIKKEMEIE